jgi:hypothetical protein
VTIFATLELYNSPKKLQGMTNNIGQHLLLGETTPRITISIEQDN